MTNPDTLRAVVATLRDLKIDAALEYPGWISVTADGDDWQFGTANGTWEGDRGGQNERDRDTASSDLAPETDAATVAAWIVDVVDGVTPDACPDCARSHGPHYRGSCEHGVARLTILIPSAALLGVVLSLAVVL